MTFSAGALWSFAAHRLLVTLAAASCLTVEAQATPLGSHTQCSSICQPGSMCVINSPGALSSSNAKITHSFFASSLTMTESSVVFQRMVFTDDFSRAINRTDSDLAKNSHGKLVPTTGRTLGENVNRAWQNDSQHNGATVHSMVTTKAPFSGSSKLSQGITLVITAEPAPLGLMGIGLTCPPFLVQG
jgi:hypothetical protein